MSEKVNKWKGGKVMEKGNGKMSKIIIFNFFTFNS